MADDVRSDGKLMRVAAQLEPDIARMLETQAARTAMHDAAVVVLAEAAGASATRVSFRSGADIVWEPRAEPIGVYAPAFGIFRWAWADPDIVAPDGGAMADAYAAAARLGLSAFASEAARVTCIEDAALVARICARLALADGLFESQDGGEITYYALFDRSPSAIVANARAPGLKPSPAAASPAPARATVAPPVRAPVASGAVGPAPALSAPRRAGPRGAVTRPDPRAEPSDSHGDAPPQAALASHEGWGDGATAIGRRTVALAERAADRARATEPPSNEPKGSLRTAPPQPASPPGALPAMTRTAAVCREPAREILVPVIREAFASAANAAASTSSELHQGMLVLNVEVVDGTLRRSAAIVASSAAGDLVVAETPPALLDAIDKMIAKDADQGNGRWRRLTARMTRNARGLAVDVNVLP